MSCQKRVQAALSPMHTHTHTRATHANIVFVSFSFHINFFFSFRSISFPSMSASSSTLVYNYFHLLVCTMNSGYTYGYSTEHISPATDGFTIYIFGWEIMRSVMVAVGLAFSYIHIRHHTLHFFTHANTGNKTRMTLSNNSNN